MADEIDEIRRRIDLVDLIGHQVRLKRTGKNYTGLCPFHEDRRPSFSVSPDVGRYRCWSCGEAGDAFTWVMKTQNVEFVEALRLLAERTGVTLTRGAGTPKTERAAMAAAMNDALAYFREQLSKSTVAREYCDRRGLDPATLDAWEMGYAPDVGEALATHLKKAGHALSECKNLFLVDQDPSGGYFDKFRGRLIFPIRDERGELVAFGGRLLGDGVPKYINSSDTPIYRKSRVLYGLHRARETLQKTREAVLCEGYLDVIACHRAGVNGALASLGTALSEEHAKLLKRWCDSVTVLYDRDAAGEKAAARAMPILRAEGLKVRVALMPDGHDPDTLLREGGAAAVQRAAEGGLRPLEFRIQAIEARFAPEQDEFWAEVVEALAEATNELEVDRYLSALAPRFPGVRDPLQAQKNLRTMVQRRRRRGQARDTDVGPAVSAREVARAVPIPSAERTVLLAYAEPSVRAVAWEAVADPALFTLDRSAAVAAALGNAFPGGPPSGAPSEWLERLPEEERTVYADLLMSSSPIHLTEEFVRGAVEKLRQDRERRELRDLRSGDLSEDKLRELNDRLRRLKGEPSQDS